MGVGRMLAAAAAAAMMFCGSANAACWSPRAIEAAKVRDFDTMLMVATLRCRTQGVVMGDAYNRFVREKRAVLSAVNDELRAQTADGRRGKVALEAYDRFVTSIANRHGAGTGQYGCEDFRLMVVAGIEAAPDRAALLDLATRAGADPVLPAARCVTIAMAR